MKYPLVSICIAFSLGILAGIFFKIGFLFLYLIAVTLFILSIIFIKQNLKFNIFILCIVFFLGAAVLKSSQAFPPCHISKFTQHKSEPVYLIGIIDSDPVYKDKYTSLVFKTEELQKGNTRKKTCGDVLVKIYNKDEFSYGDRLFLEGKLSRPFSFSKDFDYESYLKLRNIYSVLSVRARNTVKFLDKGIGNPIKSFAFRMKHRMSEVIIANLPTFSAGILSAIILGDRENLPLYVKDALVKSGSVHIIAISGLHVGIIAFIILAILKIIRIPVKFQYITAIILLILYCILTGARTPVIRATVMAVVLLFGYFLRRQVNIYNSLSIAALAIMAVNPQQVLDVSFQLSFLSVISIIWLSPKIKSLFSKELYRIKWLRFLILAFSVSTAAWLGLLPLIAYYFKIVAPVTILANMILIPIMSVIVASGFTLALTGILIPGLASIFAESCNFIILTLVKINSLLITLPGAYFKISGLSLAYVFIYYAFLMLIFNFAKIKKMI